MKFGLKQKGDDFSSPVVEGYPGLFFVPIKIFMYYKSKLICYKFLEERNETSIYGMKVIRKPFIMSIN
jgi:hypothetical protein